MVPASSVHTTPTLLQEVGNKQFHPQPPLPFFFSSSIKVHSSPWDAAKNQIRTFFPREWEVPKLNTDRKNEPCDLQCDPLRSFIQHWKCSWKYSKVSSVENWSPAIDQSVSKLQRWSSLKQQHFLPKKSSQTRSFTNLTLPTRCKPMPLYGAGAT